MAPRTPSAVDAGLGNVSPSQLSTPRQNLNAPAAAFGARSAERMQETGRGLMAAGTVAFKAAAQQKTAEDNARVKDAERQLGTFTRSALFLDDNAYYKQRGLDAMKGYDELEKSLREQRDAILDSLDNEQQKEAYFQRSERAIASKLNEAAQHRFRESENYQTEQTAAIIEEAIEDATLDYRPENIAANLARGRAEIVALAEKQGASPEETQRRLDDFDSAVYSGVINTMLENDPDAAKELYDKPAVQSRIRAAERAVIEKNLKTQMNKREIIETADQIMLDSGDDEEAAIKAAAKIDDPDVRKGVEDRLNIMYGRQRQARKAAQDQADKDAWNMALSNGNLEVLPANVMNSMSPAAQVSLREYMTKRANGEFIRTDWNIYDQMMTTASTPETVQDFMDLNLEEEYRHVLSNTHLKQMIDLQAKIRSDPEEYLTSVQTLTQQMNTAIDKMDLVGTNNAVARGKFRDAVGREADRKQAELGRELTFEENQAIIDGMMIQVKSDPTGWGIFNSDVADIAGMRYELDPRTMSAQQRAAYKVPLETMPPEVEASVRANLAKDGFTNPSDAFVERAAGIIQLNDKPALQELYRTERANAATR